MRKKKIAIMFLAVVLSFSQMVPAFAMQEEETEVSTETDEDASDEEPETSIQEEPQKEQTEGSDEEIENPESERAEQENAEAEKTEESRTEEEDSEQNEKILSYDVTMQNGSVSSAENGEIAGSTGQSSGITQISIQIGAEENQENIRYRVCCEDSGWLDWKTDGDDAEKAEGESYINGFQAELTGELSEKYDLYYCAHVQNFGWLGWAKNGEKAGSQGFSYRMEAVKMCLVKKGEQSPGENQGVYYTAFETDLIAGNVHVQTDGDKKITGSTEIIGTVGESKRIEAISLQLQIPEGEEYLTGGIRYRTHVENIGWQDWKADGEQAGTTGKSLRLEALQIELTGEIAKHYDIYYSTHIQNFGWLGWAKNGQNAGSESLGYRMEALKIMIVQKNEEAPGENKGYFIQGCAASKLKYSGHVQNIGNLAAVGNNSVLGTIGKSLRLEGVRIFLDDAHVGEETGGIQYRGHVQNIGWQSWKTSGELAGTSGKSLRLEAIQIQLTGSLAKYYDIYYRVHVQQFGWLGWAKNGQSAGTVGYGYRAEAIQILFQMKTQNGPANIGYYKEYIPKKTMDVNLTYQNPDFPNGCEAISLYMVLRYNGYMVTKEDVCYKYMPRGPLHSTNPYLAYMGDPGSLTGGYGCWASVICTTAENYFKDASITSKTPENITGSSLEQLFSYIDRNIPVVVWGTLGMGSTTWFKAGSSDGVDYYWPSRAHCVVLTGYDRTRKVVKVNDPIEGKVEYSFSSFQQAYETMNKNAMVIE